MLKQRLKNVYKENFYASFTLLNCQGNEYRNKKKKKKKKF